MGSDKNREIEIPEGIKGFIFDLDGTLADTMSLHYTAFTTVMKQHNVDFSVERFLAVAGVPIRPICDMVNREENKSWTVKDMDKISDMKQQIFEDNLHLVKEITPVADLVRKYRGEIKMACGTGNEKDVSHTIIEMLGFKEDIPVVVTAQDVVKHKPHPETFLEAARLLGLKPEECLVFEDAQPGFDAAKAAGMQCIDVTNYYTVKIV